MPWFDVFSGPSARAVQRGCVVCTAPGPAQVTIATAERMLEGRLVVGIALNDAAPGEAVSVVEAGLVGADVIGIGRQSTVVTVFLTSSGRCATSGTPLAGGVSRTDVAVGEADVDGNLLLRARSPGASPPVSGASMHSGIPAFEPTLLALRSEVERLARRVAELEAAVSAQPNHTDRVPPPPHEPDADASLESIIALLRANKKIDAIKLYREVHHVGLVEAKDAVERIAENMP